MTERAKIIGLARKCHSESLSQHGYGSSMYALTDSAIVALYKQAQNEAYEKAALALDKPWNGDTDTYMRADNYTRADTCNECAAAIRSLKGQS